VKQLSRSERQSFLEFAPDYFRYVATMLHRGQETCLAKVLGVYQVGGLAPEGAVQWEGVVLHMLDKLLFINYLSSFDNVHKMSSSRSRRPLAPYVICTAAVLPALPACPLQVSVQYTGGRGAPAAPPFGGKEGVMDLLVTENVFYGRDSQVDGCDILMGVVMWGVWVACPLWLRDCGLTPA
jgi:hypothetical protein